MSTRVKRETLLWMTEIRDEYVLDAIDQIPDTAKYIRTEDIKMRHPGVLETYKARNKNTENVHVSEKKHSRKGAVIMYIGIGLGAAAVVAAAWMGGMMWQQDEKTPIKDPATLEETSWEVPETAANEQISTILGLKEDERLVISVSDERDIVVDGNMSMIAELPEVDRYFEPMEDLTSEYYMEFDHNLDEKKINPFIVKEDAVLICGNEQLGLYSLSEQKWVLEPVYRWVYPLSDGHYLAQSIEESENGEVTIDAKLVTADGSIVYEWDKLDRTMLCEEGSYLITDEAIYDLNGNQVYQLNGWNLLEIIQDTALIGTSAQSSPQSSFINLKTKEVLAAVDYYADAFEITYGRLGENVWSISTANTPVTDHVFDEKNRTLMAYEEFKARIPVEDQMQNKGITAYNGENGEYLAWSGERLSSYGIQEGLIYTVSVLDGEWNINRRYENIIGTITANGYGIQENGTGYELVNFWTDERMTIPDEIDVKACLSIQIPADGWLRLYGSDEIGIPEDTLVLDGKVIASDVYWIEQLEDAFECEIITDSGEHLIEYYSMDGKKLSETVNVDEISYLSSDHVAVIRNGECVFLDWDGNELGRCIAE